MFEPIERKWLSLYCTDFVALAEDAFGQLSQKSPPGSPIAQHSSLEEASSVDGGRKAALSPQPDGPPSDEEEEEEAAPPEVFFLPDSVMRAIFGGLDAEALSCAAQTCIAWRAYAYEPSFWRRIALRTWPGEDQKELERLLWTASPPGPYGTWRRLLIYRPHVRFSGIYVMRHQYAKSRGAALNQDGSTAPPVFLVTYWRMLRFYPDGTVVALTTPEAPERAFRRLRRGWEPPSHDSRALHPSEGKFDLDSSGKTLDITLPVESKLHPLAMKGWQHISMALSSSHAGAFNRLYTRDHFAIMEDGSVVSYQTSEGGDYFGKAWRLVPLYGFSRRVYEHFPREAAPDGSLDMWRSANR